mgnify:FL=1|tara:strand:+ start:337 stop:1188 length:852 start_codon:yes stop_codon:yes gene_type:complete
MDELYLAVSFDVRPISGVEILIAELSYLEFEMFEENQSGLIAYIKESNFSKNIFDKVRILNSKEFKIDYEISKVQNKNWNEKWEKNFDPVEIGQNCTIRAPFHNPSKKIYDIIIKPEMSFGTGHHETTQLMIEYLLEQNLENMSVCDVGCGTGILSIIAEKRGAKLVDAVDININCIHNTIGNIKRNNCYKIKTIHSTSEVLIGNFYETILSNITLNNLKENFENFNKISNDKTILILSGFYKNDLEEVNKVINNLGFIFSDSKSRNNWVASRYYRKQTQHLN